MNRKTKLQRRKEKKKTTPMDEAELRREMESRGMKPLSYKIHYRPMEDDGSVPEEAAKDLEEMYYGVRKSPREALGRLKELIRRFPQVRQFRNYLTVALGELGQKEAMDAAAKETFELFPDYLFARVLYGQSLVRRGKLAETKALFPSGIEPQLMYPERVDFHVTEVLAVYMLAGVYHAKMGEIDNAQYCIDTLEDVDPDCVELEIIGEELAMAKLKRRINKLWHLR